MILRNFKNKNKGMTYVELIVVLSIFSTLSAVVIFNYGAFQDKIDVKNLVTDIALKIVEAQKSSISGRVPPRAVVDSWRTSYGLYIDVGSNNKLKYFVDTVTSIQNQQDGILNDPSDCTTSDGECLDEITVAKGGSISSINVFYQDNEIPYTINDLHIAFIRPSGAAILNSSSGLSSGVNYIEVEVVSPRGYVASIKIFPSGRIELD